MPHPYLKTVVHKLLTRWTGRQRSADLRQSESALMRGGFAGRAAILPALMLLLGPGCGAPDTSRQLTGTDYDRETVIFEQVSRLDFGIVARAYVDLAAVPHRLRTSSTQRDAEGRPIASETKVVQVSSDSVTVTEVAGEGSMSTGFMRFMLTDDSLPELSRSVAELWTPREPAFTSPRNRDYYRYAMAQDTVVAGEPCLTFVVRALDGISPDRMPTRRARFYVAVADSSILGVQIERQDDAIFYHEHSSLLMTLQRMQDRVLPLQRRVDVEVKAPLRSTHYFSMMQEYSLERPNPDPDS